jgi:hypothetical protein
MMTLYGGVYLGWWILYIVSVILALIGGWIQVRHLQKNKVTHDRWGYCVSATRGTMVKEVLFWGSIAFIPFMNTIVGVLGILVFATSSTWWNTPL